MLIGIGIRVTSTSTKPTIRVHTTKRVGSLWFFPFVHRLLNTIEWADNACILEVFLHIADVSVNTERNVVNLVGYIDIPRLLIQGAKQVGVAVCGQVQISR